MFVVELGYFKAHLIEFDYMGAPVLREFIFHVLDQTRFIQYL